jgi:hypothetical protein
LRCRYVEATASRARTYVAPLGQGFSQQILLQSSDSVFSLTNRLNGVVPPPPPPPPRIGRKHANVAMHASTFSRAPHLGGAPPAHVDSP